MFNHLKVPESWNSYFSKYPNGLTIMEALCDWVGQVDSMIDHINTVDEHIDYLNKNLEEFYLTFQENLSQEIIKTLQAWIEDGTLGEVISQLIEGRMVFQNIQALQAAPNVFKLGTVIELLGYYTAGDGAGHKRIIADADDGSGVPVGNKWANIVSNDKVNVDWFGAKADGTSDDYPFVQKAFDYALKSVMPHPTQNQGKNRDAFKNIEFNKKNYLINSTIKFNTTNGRTMNLTISLNKSNIFYNATLFDNPDLVGFINFDDGRFTSLTATNNFMNSVSNGGAQRYIFKACTWEGDIDKGINMTGGNNNSEFKFETCQMGVFNTNGFVYCGSSDSSDQFLNYWFVNVSYWSKGPIVNMAKGGHIHLVDCDFSGYVGGTNPYLFDIKGSGHGVQTFIDKGSRYELKSENAKVIRAASDMLKVKFIDSDFGSQAFVADRLIPDCFNFYTATQSTSVGVHFQGCKIMGGFKLGGGVGTGRKLLFENCDFYFRQEKFADAFVFENMSNPGRNWDIEFLRCDYKNTPMNGRFGKTSAPGNKTIITETYQNSQGRISQEVVKPIYMPTFLKVSTIQEFASIGHTFKFSVRSRIGIVTAVDAVGKSVTITPDAGAVLFAGNSINTNGSDVNKITYSSQSANIYYLENTPAFAVGSVVYVDLLNFTTSPVANRSPKIYNGVLSKVVNDIELYCYENSANLGVGVPGWLEFEIR